MSHCVQLSAGTAASARRAPRRRPRSAVRVVASLAVLALCACQASLDLDRLSFEPDDAGGGQGGAAGTGTMAGAGGATSGAGGSGGSSTAGAGGSEPPDASGGAGGTAAHENAAPCGGPAECASGFCVDAVCCSVEACSGCHSCAVPGSEGQCTALPAGSDPRDECQPGVCNAEAACAVTLASAHYGDASNQSVTAVAVDGSGNIFIAGTVFGQMVIGADTLSAIDEDVFIAKLDGAGNPLWAKSFSGEVVQFVRGIAVGPSGEVALVGNFFGTFSLGGDALASSGGDLYNLGDIFVAKLDADGNHVFSKSFGGPGRDETANDVAIDPNGNVILVGDARGVVNFGGDPLDPVASSAIFVAKLDAAGAHVWSRMYGQDAADEGASAVATNSSGEVIIGGSFSGATILFPPDDLHNAVDETDGFLLKLSAAGDVVWSDTLGGTGLQFVTALDVDSADNIVIGGQFFGTIDLGAAVLTSIDGSDAFVTVRNSAGVLQWQRQLGGSGFQNLSGVAVDAGGRVSATGYFGGSIDLGDTERFATGAGSDIYVATYTPSGEVAYASHYGDPNDQQPADIAASGTQFMLGGFVQGTVDFGNGSLTAEGSDAFVAVIAP